MNIKMKRLSDTAIYPTYGSEKAACLDLYADFNQDTVNTFKTVHSDFANLIAKNEELNIYGIKLPPHATIKIGCGFAFQPPEGYAGLILARSGLSTKQGLRPANCVGVCDEDYTGEYIIPLHNDNNISQTIYHGDRIAQLMFIPYYKVNLLEVDELDQTQRGSNGFGSTGK